MTWVRGIHCDHWFINFTGNPFNFSDTAHSGSHMYQHWTFELFFTELEWLNPGNFKQVPIRAILTGVSLRNSHRYLPNFERTFDYSSFIPGKQPNYYFRVPQPCDDAPPSSGIVGNDEFGLGVVLHSTAANTIGAIILGIGIPVTIIGFFIGIIIAFFAAVMERKKSPQGQGFEKVANVN